MPTHVYANTHEVVSKSAEGKSIAAFPDVCVSPPAPPAGPTPLPYPNTGEAKNLDAGTGKVFIQDKMVGMEDASCISKSMGDEAATQNFSKGLVTGALQGKVFFQVWSMDVKAEGKGVQRNLDLTTHNHGSAPGNTPPVNYVSGQSPTPDANALDTKNSDLFFVYMFHSSPNEPAIITDNDGDFTQDILSQLKSGQPVDYALGGLSRHFVNIKVQDSSGAFFSSKLFPPAQVSSSRLWRHVYGFVYFVKPLKESKTVKFKLKGLRNTMNPDSPFYLEGDEPFNPGTLQGTQVIDAGEQYCVKRFTIPGASGNIFQLESTIDGVTKQSMGKIETWKYCYLNMHYAKNLTKDQACLLADSVKIEAEKAKIFVSICDDAHLLPDNKIDLRDTHTDMINYYINTKQFYDTTFEPYCMEVFMIRNIVYNYIFYDGDIINTATITDEWYTLNLSHCIAYDGVEFNDPIVDISFGSINIPKSFIRVRYDQNNLPFPNFIDINVNDLILYLTGRGHPLTTARFVIKYKDCISRINGFTPKGTRCIVLRTIQFARNTKQMRDIALLQATLIHEVGHVFGLASNLNPYYYTANQSGPHCAYKNAPPQRVNHNLRTGEVCGCVMYGASVSGRPSTYCPECILGMRASETTGWL